MERLRGLALCPGAAIAVAARLGEEFGQPALSPQRLRRIGEKLRRFGVENPEPEQVILVADRIPPHFWLAPIPGLQIVGIAAQEPSVLQPRPEIPTVVGLGDDLLANAEEDEIVIVDGDRGRVYIAPDAATVARYQAPFTLARRLFLDGGHLPARTTSDNRIVSVLAPTPTLQAVADAMDMGADGILIPADNDFLGGDALAQTAGEQVAALHDLARLVGGQPLFLHVPSERLALSALAQGAAAGPLHLILDDPEDAPELRLRLEQIESILEDDDALFGRVAFEAALSPSDDAAPVPAALDEFDGVFVGGDLSVASLERLSQIASRARSASKPMTMDLRGDWWVSALGEALGLGFGRLIVPLADVQDVKDAIREA
jgi:hypothetical protein